MVIWPNFFIVGASKAGTSSLYAYLNNIPGIFMSSVKEPNFLSSANIKDRSVFQIRNEKEYLDLFKNVKNEKIIGEASPHYLSDPESPRRIYQVSPRAKILISLRDPVERAFSHYLMYVRSGWIKSTFQEVVNTFFEDKNRVPENIVVGRGIYYDPIKRYLDLFGQKHIKILVFEEFIENPKSTIEEILKFLDLKYEIKNFQVQVYNKYGAPRDALTAYVFRNKSIKFMAEKLISASSRKFLKERFLLKQQSKPEMDKSDKEKLIKFYRDDVVKIKTLLGRDLPWKNFDKL